MKLKEPSKAKEVKARRTAPNLSSSTSIIGSLLLPRVYHDHQGILANEASPKQGQHCYQSVLVAVSFHCGFQSLSTSLQGTHPRDQRESILGKEKQSPFKAHIK